MDEIIVFFIIGGVIGFISAMFSKKRKIILLLFA